MPRILAGELMPDQPGHLNTGLVVADGVIPIANGYAPFPSFVATSNATLPAVCLGAASTRAPDGSAIVLAGTATNLYQYQGVATGWTSRASALAASASIGWQFCQSGNRLLATNGVDPIKSMDLVTPGAMASLSASAPLARYLAVVREFTVAGYAAGTNLRVQWSDRNAPTSWTAGGASLAGQADMASGGDITGIVGGEYGVILQEFRAVRMSYTADPINPFQFDEISANVGCVAPWSVAAFGRMIFFLSARGFMVCDGTSITPIGSEKIDRTFIAASNRANYSAMSAVVDPRNTLFIVALPSANPTTTLYIYNWTLSRWATATVTVQKLLVGMSQSVTLEDLNALYASIDAMTTSLDDPQFRAGNPSVYGVNGSNILGSFSGLPVAATVTTGDMEMILGRRVRIGRARPLTDAVAPTLTIAGRRRLSDAAAATTFTTINPGAGDFPVRASAAFNRFTLGIPALAAWTYCQGVDVDFTDAGRP